MRNHFYYYNQKSKSLTGPFRRQFHEETDCKPECLKGKMSTLSSFHFLVYESRHLVKLLIVQHNVNIVNDLKIVSIETIPILWFLMFFGMFLDDSEDRRWTKNTLFSVIFIYGTTKDVFILNGTWDKTWNKKLMSFFFFRRYKSKFQYLYWKEF